VYAVPESPLSQPRNVIAGNVLACIVGLLFRYLTVADSLLRWLAGALAVSCSIVLMQLTKTLHPPAGATALVAATTTDPAVCNAGLVAGADAGRVGFAAMVVLG
jgi:CBS domain-containing membrane protein